jgi:hypothetical protein
MKSINKFKKFFKKFIIHVNLSTKQLKYVMGGVKKGKK